MRKITLLFIAILVLPAACAADCGLLNLASCLPQKLFEFIISILNAPLQPLLSLIKSLLTEPVDLSLFSSLWAIIIYVLSLFYGILLLYSGFNFILSGYDAVKRANAKEWFRNIFVMIVLVQASYFLYSIVVELNSILASAMINMIDDSFFKLTADNIVNLGLQFFFLIFYVLILLISVILLVIRYIIVAAGVVLIPIAIFLYFIPPLQDYGKLIMNFLGICIFLTFFDSIILLVCSRLIYVPLFANFKILVMIAAFTIANLLMVFLMLFAAMQSTLSFNKKGSGIAS